MICVGRQGTVKMKFEKLTTSNGRWQNLLKDWAAQCQAYDEPFEDYASSTIPTLEDLANEPDHVRAGVYGLHDGQAYRTVCQANVASLPHTHGLTLRIRHILVCPAYDFEDVSEEELGTIMGQLLFSFHMLSCSEMTADHIRIHLRSPMEMTYFRALAGYMAASEVVKKVEARGAWIYLTK